MPDTASALANDQDSPSLSQFERVVDTFIEPSKTFHDIKRNRSWWLPFVIIAVLGYIFCFVAVQHVGWDSMVTNIIKSNPKSAARLEQQTPAQQAQTFAVTKGFVEGFMAGGPVVILAINAIFALVLGGCFAFLLGGATNYGEMFAVSHLRLVARRARYPDRHRNRRSQRPAGLQPESAVARRLGALPGPDCAGMAAVHRQVSRPLFAMVAGALRLRRSDRGQGKAAARRVARLWSLAAVCARQDRLRCRLQLMGEEEYVQKPKGGL